MFQLIIDEEIQLGLLEKRHAARLIALQNASRAYLREWLPWVDYSTTTEHAEQFIAASLQQFTDQNGFQAGIFYRGKLVGIIGLHAVNWSNRSTSIGYWLAEAYQGYGIMRRACEGLIAYCFDTYQLHRIEIRVATDNEKSQAIPKKLGFTVEGISRQAEWLYDHFVDHYVYSLLRTEFTK